MNEARLKGLLDGLDRGGGNRERYLAMLTDKDALLTRICSNAASVAESEGCEPWSIIGMWTGHGSGVSSAIYELYRKQPEAAATLSEPTGETK